MALNPLARVKMAELPATGPGGGAAILSSQTLPAITMLILTVSCAGFRMFTACGYGVLAVSYRGYGGSTGSPTQDGLMQDGEAAYREARARL
jgi:hypothetical protein